MSKIKLYTGKLFSFRLIILIIIALTSLFTNTAKSQTLPSGFSQVLVASGISNPTVMAFSPDGRIFVAQQSGELRIIKNGALLAQPFVSLSVNSSGERGLLGIAFDPAFTTNNYIYLYYTVSSATHNRISRFTANGDVVVPGSELVILDLDPLSSATNHNGGTMQFGPDGKLYVGIGENANGNNSQNLDTYHGKVIRINSNGTVPAGNPFTSGSNQRLRVWSYGLRNPYTLTFQPGTGRLFVNDVGAAMWEEINEATTGGLNFGWPTAEGNSTNPAFTNPIYTYMHGSSSGQGCAITGGTFFNPVSSNYPSTYTGKYFYIDYCGNWIDMLTLSGSTATRTNFASNIAGFPVSLVTGNDGNLYFLSRSNNSVYKITYSSGSAPLITSHPQSQTVAQGNPVTFNVTASGATPLTYQWRKNSVNISGANSSSYTISSVNTADAGTYSVVVSNSFGSTTSNNATLTVTAANQYPSAVINSPNNNSTYAAGTNISYTGSATDPEDGTLGAASFEWYVTFHHSTHTHPGPTASDGVTSGTFSIPNSGETAVNVFYRLYLVVTDSQGARDTAFIDILPRTTLITINTNPPNFQILLDGQPFNTPYQVASVEGMIRTIGINSPQMSGGNSYVFSSWSDGGAQSHNITTPVNDITYTATLTTSLRPPDNPANTVNGLEYSYYHGTWNVMPDFSQLTPVVTGNVLNFDLSPRTQNDYFGFEYTGYVYVPTSGVYTFYTSSDDGSNLYIGNTLVVNNDSAHALQERSGTIGLQAGKHSIKVQFFERAGQEILTVSYEGQGISKQPIPSSALYRISSGTQTYTLNPVADSYIRNGSYAAINYGTSTVLNSQRNSTSGLTQFIFLKFKITSFPANVTSAVLRLYGSMSSTSNYSALVEAHKVIGNNWQESTITWNNRPAVKAAVITSESVSGTTPQYYEWDLTQHVIDAKVNGSKYISLRLNNSGNTSNAAVFNSKEAAANKPQLVVIAGSILREPEQLSLELMEYSKSENDFGIEIYPNPASNIVNISMPHQEQMVYVELYNSKSSLLNGKPYSLTDNLRINVENLPGGMYFIRLYNDTMSEWRKIIISK